MLYSKGLVQFLQFRYQRGVLYRLRALGERHNMDITIEGFHSWMWRGLSFLLPFLFIGYFFQMYNAYVLYLHSYDPEASWQVRWIMKIAHFIFFVYCPLLFFNVCVNGNYKKWIHVYALSGACLECPIFICISWKHHYNHDGHPTKTQRKSEAER